MSALLRSRVFGRQPGRAPWPIPNRPVAHLPHSRLPTVTRRDQYDYPKRVRFVRTLEPSVELERFWCLADRPCADGCGWSIAAHTFYVRVYDYTNVRSIGRLTIPTEADYHVACVPDDLSPALTILEVPA